MTQAKTYLINSLKHIALLIVTSLLFTSCGSSKPSFSLLSINEKLDQDLNSKQISKVDILWVIDNSISMRKAQENLTTNFESFITNFSEQDLDYQIAVAATDSFRSNPKYSDNVKPTFSQFRDGARHLGAKRSGVHVITPETPNLNQTFITNAKLGTLGFGDERAFSSIESSFNDSFNDSFLREDSFLAIIIVSDEDDYSYNGKAKWDGISGSKPTLYPVSRFIDFLDNKTGLLNGNRRYNVSSIHIKSGDTQCLNSLRTGDQRFGVRYEQLVNQTSGNSISLCSDFSKSLDKLSEDIILASLNDTFMIKRRPVANSIIVKVNGNTIRKSINGSEGWTYLNPSEGEYLIRFSAGTIPPSGAEVDIVFDPYEF